MSVLAGIENSVEVVISVCGSWVREEEQIEVQLVTVHLMMVERDTLQSSCRYELMENSSLRRNCNGDESEDPLGISVMIGRKHAIDVTNHNCDVTRNGRAEEHTLIRGGK